MDYRKKLQTRLYIGIAYIVIGIALAIISYVTATDNVFISSYGIALIAVGAVRIRNHIIITRSEERIRQQEIAETDERNIMLNHKAQSIAFSLYVLLTGIAVIIFALLDMPQYVMPLAWSICLLVFIYWFSYHYIRRKY